MLLGTVRIWTLMLFLFAFYALSGSAQQTFTNPVFKGADPSVIMVGGMFYSVGSGCPDGQLNGSHGAICIRASSTLIGLGSARPVVVWRAPHSGLNSADIWAPDLEYFDGKWYIYYAADSGTNNHRLFALVPDVPGQVLGSWSAAPTGESGGQLPISWGAQWAIDPDVFIASDHKLYLTYSCRPTDNVSQPDYKFQGICISAMRDALHPAGQVVKLSAPTQPWEIRNYPTEEGPVGFTHNGVTYIVYSGSFSGSPDSYAAGLLSNDMPPQPNGVGNPLLNPASWVKKGPIFDGHHAAYGTASVVLVESSDHTELWNVYHGVNCLTDCPPDVQGTWSSRSNRMQKAFWSATGDLVLGYPVDIVTKEKKGAAVPLALPSTDGKGSSVLPAWGPAFGDAAEGDTANGLQIGEWQFSQAAPGSIRSIGLNPRRYDQIFFGANPNLQNYVLTADVQLIRTGAGDSTAKYGVYGAYVDHRNYYVAMFDVSSCGAPGCLTTGAVVDGADRGWKSCPLPAGFDAKAVNHLTLEAVNGDFTLAVNDKLLNGACQNRKFFLAAGQVLQHGSNGQVGAIIADAEATYTNFNVSYGVPQDSQTAAQDFNAKYNLAYLQAYAFRNRASHMNLDNHCAGCKGAAAGSVQVIQYPTAAPYPLTASATQLWALRSTGSGYFMIRSMLSGKCLADPGNSSGLQQLPCKSSSTQNWSFIPRGDGYFTISNQASSLVLESTDARQGSTVRLSQPTNSEQQQWLLVIQ